MMNNEKKREGDVPAGEQQEFISHNSSFIIGFPALGVSLAAAGYFYYVHCYSHPGHWGLLTTFRHLVDLDRNPYRYYGDNLDWAALGEAAGAALALIVVGLLALHALDLYIPKLARMALAYVVGLGAVGVLLEVETILGFYTRESIIGTLAFAALCFGVAAECRIRRRITPGRSAPNWGIRRVEIALEYQARYRESLSYPTGALAVGAYALLLLLIALVTLLTFYHGSLCPVTYWDSLILYVGYAREIFYQHAFPFKAVAQVGIGLGANYPHLYALISAATATVVGRWSDSFAQVAPPLAGLLSCVLVYHTALRLTRHVLLALALTAIFRTIPYGIAYFIYASDYAFVMLFTAAFLYAALCYLETGLVGYFIVATLIPAFAMHLNYLMGLLWVLWGAMLLLAHARPFCELSPDQLESLTKEDITYDPVAITTVCQNPPNLAKLMASRRLWTWLIVGIVVAAPWYVRNWVLTGNPVYAFFKPLFPKTVHYNQEAMDSAVVEWTLNGDGIGKASLTRDFKEHLDRFQRSRDVSGMEIARINTPLLGKIAASWPFWVTDFNAWKMAPSFLGIALPSVLIFLFMGRRPGCLDLTERARVTRRRFGWLCFLFLLLLLGYHYALADLYLYQIIPLVVLIPLFGAHFAQALVGRLARGLFVALAIWMAVFPGLPMALMGFKIKSAVHMGDRLYSPFELVALHNVGLDAPTFYQMAFGEDVFAWAALNTYCLDAKVLTHENRHLVLDRRVRIVHFDDWDVQALWRKSPDEQLRGLRDLGIAYYLFVPNETKHQVNRRIGPPAQSDIGDEQWRWLHDPKNKDPDWWRLSALRGWIENGVLELVEQCGDNRLYRFKWK